MRWNPIIRTSWEEAAEQERAREILPCRTVMCCFPLETVRDLLKSATKHIVISTVLCALTLVVFLAFYNRLPESVPIHFDSAGVANSFWPRNVVVFGVPVACVLLNLISGFTVSQKENAKPYMYYIMAVVAFVATGIMIYLGMK